MPRRLLMLDSGAFGVWNRGAVIDVDHYIDFCVAHPEVSYYVNLDVIPGKPGKREGRDAGTLQDGSTLLPRTTHKDVEAACQAGWQNYLKMLKHLPMEKVIPVFHQDDGFHWLDKYMQFGTPYLGISPANDRKPTTALGSKGNWLSEVKKKIFDKQGNPLIRTHGFAVTSFDLMQYMEWYSVDSASWKLIAAWGSVYVPRKKNGVYDYSQSPRMVGVSPMSPHRVKKDGHTNTPRIMELTKEFLQHMKVPLGVWHVKTVGPNYKVKPLEELWFNKAKREVLVIDERGVATTHEFRTTLNAEVIKEANKVLPVRHIYFAGAPMKVSLEEPLTKRLFTFVDVGKKTPPPAWNAQRQWLKESRA